MTEWQRSVLRRLTASYIAGAVADGVVGILMLIPDRMGETDFRVPRGLGASLMFGWTALLLWANRKPVERKGVLLLTIFPVITGLLASLVWAGASGRLSITRILPSVILCVVLIALMGFSYWKASRTG
jgi:drug/metabolite transporter (DMT)-like permease